MPVAQSESVVLLAVRREPGTAARALRAAVRPAAALPVAVAPSIAATFDVTEAYDEHGSSLFGFAINALRDRGLAEDCVQETFLRAWRARDRYNADRASTRTWLFSIARNVIIDMQRSIQRMPRTLPDDQLSDAAVLSGDPLERLRMIEALAVLSPEHRQVVVEIHLNGSTYAELSAASGVPIGTLRTRAFYGLRALRDYWSSDHGEKEHNGKDHSDEKGGRNA